MTSLQFRAANALRKYIEASISDLRPLQSKTPERALRSGV
jgi:hypothetical protein